MSKNNRQKTVLFFGAGTEHQIAIKMAKKMGYKVIAADANPKAPGLKYADVSIIEDIKNIDKMVAVGKKYKVDGVMVHAVEIPHIVSRVAKALGLPGIEPKIADRATFKYERIAHLKKAGLNVPEYEVVNNLAEATKAAKKIGYPVVVKPTDNAGARGVKLVKNEKELGKSFEESKSYRQEKSKILIEQFLAGQEISTESLIYNGKIYTTGFGDRNYTRQDEFYPYFVEDGHSVPSVLPEKIQKEILVEVEKTIKALGITWGVAKGDILLHRNKIYIIEMAARTSGGWFCAGTVPLATGVHILRPLIKMAVGDEANESDIKVTKNLWACQRYVIPVRSGKFVKIEGVSEARKMPGVKMLIMFKKPKKGEMIHRATNHAERFGQLITVGKDIKEATRMCENAIKKIKIVLDN